MKAQIAIYVGAFLLFGSKILILQRSRVERSYANLWEIPGGRMKPTETLFEACVRETLEETGIGIQRGEPVSVMEFWKNTNLSRTNCVQVNFLCALTDAMGMAEIVLSSEHERYRWVPWNSFGEGLTSHELRDSWRSAALKMEVAATRCEK